MEADMKKNNRSLAIIGIVLLLGIGYLIPTIVMQLKDWSLIKEEKEVEIEAIQIEPQETDLIEALSGFSDMFAKYMIVEVGDDFTRSYAEVVKEDSSSVPNKLYNNVQSFLRMLDVKEMVVLVEFTQKKYSFPLLSIPLHTQME